MSLKEQAQNAYIISKRLVGYGLIGAAVMGGLWINYATPSNLIASSPDRIIPQNARDMAPGAANPDSLVLRVCNAETSKYDKELLLRYGEHMQLAYEGPEGLALKPYNIKKENVPWDCNR